MNIFRILKYIGNAFAFTTLVYLAFTFYPVNVPLVILFVLVAYDQLEDLLGVKVSGLLVYADIFYELICFGIGAMIAMFGYTYYNYFYAPFHLAIMLSGITIMLTSLWDIREDIVGRSVKPKSKSLEKCFWVRE